MSAIPFIEQDDNGDFNVTVEAMSVLQSMSSNKLAVICVAGPYRSGKSFIANRLLDQMDGFNIGSSVRSCTKGIWMWSEPVPIKDGVDALIIDTEGLKATDQ